MVPAGFGPVNMTITMPTKHTALVTQYHTGYCRQALRVSVAIYTRYSTRPSAR